MNAQPDPMVSGSSLPPNVPLLWRTWTPDAVVTSVSVKPTAFCANRSAAVADATMPAPQARRNSRRDVADIFFRSSSDLLQTLFRARSWQRHQTVGDRVHDQLGGLVHAERVHDVRAVDGHGIDAQVERLGNFAIQ